jgi:hypothetical protein
MLYETAVEKAKAILNRVEKNLWDLAKILYELEPKYGDHTLERFAKDIGLALKTIRYYRQAYERFGQMAGRPAIWVATELLNVPNAEQIIAENPNLSRSAARGMRQATVTAPPPQQPPPPPPPQQPIETQPQQRRHVNEHWKQKFIQTIHKKYEKKCAKFRAQIEAEYRPKYEELDRRYQIARLRLQSPHGIIAKEHDALLRKALHPDHVTALGLETVKLHTEAMRVYEEYRGIIIAKEAEVMPDDNVYNIFRKK